jgi:hypothetical protein
MLRIRNKHKGMQEQKMRLKAQKVSGEIPLALRELQQKNSGTRKRLIVLYNFRHFIINFL